MTAAKNLKPVALRDLAEAAQMLHETYDLVVDPSELLISAPFLVPVAQLRHYDDIDSWLSLEPYELQEDESALGTFRGSRWANMARDWRSPEDIPPIVVFVSSEVSVIADGRGRTNYAIGKGWKEIPAVILEPRST